MAVNTSKLISFVKQSVFLLYIAFNLVVAQALAEKQTNYVVIQITLKEAQLANEFFQTMRDNEIKILSISGKIEINNKSKNIHFSSFEMYTERYEDILDHHISVLDMQDKLSNARNRLVDSVSDSLQQSPSRNRRKKLVENLRQNKALFNRARGIVTESQLITLYDNSAITIDIEHVVDDIKNFGPNVALSK